MLIDLPHEDPHRFITWEHDLLHESERDTVGNAVRNVTGYMREVIADRRRNPRDDFISYGIQAEIRGRPLTDDELIVYTFNLFIGGLDTVTSVMGLLFRHLAENHEHQRRLRHDLAFINTGLWIGSGLLRERE